MLKINGVRMPEPKYNGGISITKETIWSSNTGRATDGTMVGDIIAEKDKLKITWGPLSGAEVMQINSAISPAFFPVEYKDPGSNAYVTKTFYAGTPTYPVYSYAAGVPQYTGVTVDLVEQ